VDGLYEPAEELDVRQIRAQGILWDEHTANPLAGQAKN
jgi:hypothetical protein